MKSIAEPSNRFRIVLRLMIVLVTLLSASACRRQEIQAQATPFPTPSATPRSTPLPAVPTLVPPGTEANPLQMLVQPFGSLAAARDASADFESALLEQTGLIIRVQLVESYAEGLVALCASGSGQMSVAWLNGVAYMAASAQNCGTPVLQVERDDQTGEAVLLVSNRDSEISSVAEVRDRTFCRLGYDDFSSWLVPALVLRANGLDPLNTPATILDYATWEDLLRAVAGGECDVAGVPEGVLNELSSELGDARDEIVTLETSVSLPYGILMIPVGLPLGTQISLTDGLITLSEDRAQARILRDFLGQNALVPAAPDDFSDLVDFLERTGLDFAQLGN